MQSSLSRVLPLEIDEGSEAVVLEKMKRKMLVACGMLVKVVRAMEDRFGAEEVHETVRNSLHRRTPRPVEVLKTPEEDLADYLVKLENGCAGTHEWERVSESPTEVRYRFHRCMWAEVFRELGAPDIGVWLCEGDAPATRAYNPRLRCKLEKNLMSGDGWCDHAFYVAQD